jgi:hypothetical protein
MAMIAISQIAAAISETDHHDETEAEIGTTEGTEIAIGTRIALGTETMAVTAMESHHGTEDPTQETTERRRAVTRKRRRTKRRRRRHPP